MFKKILRLVRDSLHEEEGQSIIILAFAFLGILVIVGLAVDLGLLYVERVRLSRAVDAAALAGSEELPLEEQAYTRALEYLSINGYDSTNARIEFNDEVMYDPPNPKATIEINTAKYRNPETGQADRIEVIGRQVVDVFFMRLFGFGGIPVPGRAVAENVSRLDVVVILDKSGSMNFDTVCFGCDHNGPLGRPNEACDSPPPTPDADGHVTISIEAEHYSTTSHDYHDREPGDQYWALQRGYDRGFHYSPDDEYDVSDVSGAAFVATHRELGTTIESTAQVDETVPRMDYTIELPEGGTYYLWLRMRGDDMDRQASSLGGGYNDTLDYVFVSMEGQGMGRTWFTTPGDPYGRIGFWDSGWNIHDDWTWLSHSVWSYDQPYIWISASGTYTLSIWMGEDGVKIDKIVLTTKRRGYPDYYEPSGMGPESTGGLVGTLCGHDNPPDYTDPRKDPNDEMFRGEQPIHDALVAADHFIQRMDHKLDQVGIVYYSSGLERASSEGLECLWRGLDDCPNYGIITGTLYSTIAQGATNMAGGMAWGLEDLEPPPDGHGRSTTVQVMVLLTDGQANRADPGASNVRPDMWPPYNQVDEKDHVIAYAYQARERSVLIYSISLGDDADKELLEEVADITYGGYYHAVTSEELDEIFQEIADNIFLRLVE
jgi:hypothetical protein